MSITRKILRLLLCSVPDQAIYLIDLEFSKKKTNYLEKSLKRFGVGSRIAPQVVVISPGRVSIGKNCIINEFVHILGAGNVEIGDQVWIANHASIISVTHPTDVDFIGDHPQIEKPIFIEENVWIGSHAVILPGVTLGKGSVVGAGAVVTRDVPPCSIVTGVPAALLRYKKS